MKNNSKIAKRIFTIFLGLAICSGQAFATGDFWETRTPMPIPISGQATGVIGGKLYVALGAENVLQVYDPASDSWTMKAPPPTPRLGGSAAGVIDDKLYVVAGCNNFDCNSLTNRLERYDPVTETWTSMAPRVTNRSNNGKVGNLRSSYRHLGHHQGPHANHQT